MLDLPAGTTIFAEATYDNTVNDPNNPFKPRIITMMPYQARDEGSLATPTLRR